MRRRRECQRMRIKMRLFKRKSMTREGMMTAIPTMRDRYNMMRRISTNTILIHPRWSLRNAFPVQQYLLTSLFILVDTLFLLFWRAEEENFAPIRIHGLLIRSQRSHSAQFQDNLLESQSFQTPYWLASHGIWANPPFYA